MSKIDTDIITNTEVIDLDSIENIYIFYCKTKGENENYRILKPKSKNTCENKITIGGVYKMKLKDLSSPIYSPHIKGFWFEKVRIPIKDKYGKSSNLYTTNNIIGQCYVH